MITCLQLLQAFSGWACGGTSVAARKQSLAFAGSRIFTVLQVVFGFGAQHTIILILRTPTMVPLSLGIGFRAQGFVTLGQRINSAVQSEARSLALSRAPSGLGFRA